MSLSRFRASPQCTRHASPLATTLAIVISLVMGARAADAFEPEPEWVERTDSVVGDDSLDVADKIDRILAIIPAEAGVVSRAWYVGRVDIDAARHHLLTAFGNPDLPLHERLSAGRALVQPRHEHIFGLQTPDGFEKAYCEWLTRQALASRATLHHSRDWRTLTAVGEIAHIAAGFEGHDARLFDRFTDRRLGPVLIRALGMPDTVRAEGAHDPNPVIKSDGRNVARQNVPIALARLKVIEAVPALKRVVANHHDWYLRHNAAYALGRLETLSNLRSLSHWLAEHGRADGQPVDAPSLAYGLAEGVRDGLIEAARERISIWLFVKRVRTDVDD